MRVLEGLPWLEPMRGEGGKEDHGGTQPGHHGENQEGGVVQGLSAHLVHQWCPPGPHGPLGQGEANQDPA